CRSGRRLQVRTEVWRLEAVSEATERPQVLADLVNPAGLSLVAGMAKVSFALHAPSALLFPIFDVLLFGLFGLGVGYMAHWSRRFSVSVLVLPFVICAFDIVLRYVSAVMWVGYGSVGTVHLPSY